jgi:hypothetical protein
MPPDPIEVPPEVVITMRQLLILTPKQVDLLLLMGFAVLPSNLLVRP